MAKALLDHWSDLDKALFLLDSAEQSLCEEFGAGSPIARAFLTQHRARIEHLRSEYAHAS